MYGISDVGNSLRRISPYLFATAAVAAATWLEVLIARSATAPLTLTVFAFVIALAAWFGGIGPGLLALCLSAAAADFFIVEPGVFFNFQGPASAVVYAAFIAEWLIFTVLADRVYRGMRLDRAQRAEAQRSAKQADRLAQLTAALSQARTPAAAIEAAVQEPLHALGADAGAMFLISRDGATAEVARAVGYGAAAPSSVALDEKSPAADAVGRGAAVFADGPSAGRSGFASTAAIPLPVGSRVVALVQLDFVSPRTFTEDERKYLESLATRAAQALDRTWQYEYAVQARAESETQRARADQEIAERQKVELALRTSEARGRALAARTSRLHALTAALSESVTLSAVARVVVEQGRIAVGATAGEVAVLVDDGKMFESLYAEGEALTSGYRWPVEQGYCAADAVQTRDAVFVSSFEEWQQRYPRSASIAADGGYISSATVPLLVEGRALGVVAFYFTAPVNFDEEYRALMVSVAQDCAQALDRARLYEAAQAARKEAEAANRLKDEFVSIVSHELRSPLNAILGWTQMTMREGADPSLVTRALQSVHDNATRQARLIDELLDFSRVASGRIALVREPIDVRDLLRGVVEAVVPQAVAKGVALTMDSVPPLRIDGDLRRLEQVFFNLLGNALKFTPAGGRIAVEVRGTDAGVQVSVTDTGCGIAPEFLPHVFERFRQGEGEASREHGGLGLGLSIAKQLVEAHGGTIRVESEGRGRGCRFVVILPLLPGSAPSREVALRSAHVHAQDDHRALPDQIDRADQVHHAGTAHFRPH